jgi:hypothetical protein
MSSEIQLAAAILGERSVVRRPSPRQRHLAIATPQQLSTSEMTSAASFNTFHCEAIWGHPSFDSVLKGYRHYGST